MRGHRLARWTRVVLLAAVTGGGSPGATGAGFDLQGAITAAADGDTVVIPAGVYAGPVVLDRSVSLVADGEVIIDGGGDGDVLRIEAPDVTVRGLIIRNTGTSLDRENAGITVLAPRSVLEGNTLRDVLFGIYLKGAGESVIRDNVIGGKDVHIARRGDGIRLWYSPDTVIEGNEVRESRDVVMWFSPRVRLRHNDIRDGRYGLHFMYSDDNLLEDNRLTGNSVGAFLMYSRNLVLRRNVFARNRGPSGYGVGLKDMDGVTAEDNLFVGNRLGIYLDNSPASVYGSDTFSRNVIAYNDIGVAFQPSVKRNRFRQNAFIENLEQVAVLGRGQFSGNDFTPDGQGNYWSDYRGYDLDGDGIGDWAYRAESLFENLMDREPKLRLFLYSPAQQAIETASRAFPIVRPEPKFSDTAPLMRPVPVPASLRDDASARSMWPLSAALLLLGAGAMLAGARPFGRDRAGDYAPDGSPGHSSTRAATREAGP